MANELLIVAGAGFALAILGAIFDRRWGEDASARRVRPTLRGAPPPSIASERDAEEPRALEGFCPGCHGRHLPPMCAMEKGER